MIKNAGIYVVATFLNKGISFFLIPLFTFLLSPSEFGLVRQTVAIASVFVLLITFGLDEAASRFYFEQKRDRDDNGEQLGITVATGLVISLFGGILIFVFRDHAFGTFIEDARDDFVFLAIVYVVSTPVFSMYKKVLRIDEKPIRFVTVLLANTFVLIISSLYFIRALRLEGTGYFLGIALTAVLFAAYSLYKLSRLATIHIDLAKGSRSLRYGASVLPHALFSWGISGFTLVAIGVMLDSEAVGVFVAAGFVASLLTAFSQAVFDAYQPWSYRKLKSGVDGERQLVYGAHTLGLVFVAAGAVLALLSPELINLFIDERYHQGVEIAPFLVLSSTMLALGSVSVFVLYFHIEKTSQIGVASLAGAIVNIGLALFVIPAFGLMGAGIALIAANFGASLIKQILASRVIKQKCVFPDLYLLAVATCSLAWFVNGHDVSVVVKFFIILAEVSFIWFAYRDKITYLKKFVSS